MADEFAIVQTVADTGGGTQDITSSDITDFQGAIFLVSGATALNTTTAHARRSVGFCDDLGNGRVLASRSEDAQGTTDSRNEGDAAGGVVLIQSTGTAANVAVADAVDRSTSGLANGIRITWTTTPDLAYQMTVILFGGTTNLAIGGGLPPTTDTSESVGFRPDVVFFASTLGSLTGAALDYSVGFGAAVDDTGPPQASVYGRWDASQGTSDADALVDTGSAGGEAVGSGAPTYASIDVGSFEAGGFTWSRSGGSPNANYLAIEFSEARSSAVAVETLPSGTGNQAFTGLGLKPELVIGVANLMVVEDTGTDGPTAAMESLFAFSSTEEHCIATHEEEGVGTSNTDSRSEESALFVFSDDGTVGSEASLSSMDSSGFTLNFSTATAGRMVVVGIQMLVEASVVSETVQVGESISLALRRVVGETVEVSDSLIAIPGQVVSSGETVQIGDAIVTSSVARATNADRNGSTLQTGAERGSSLQGGAENATTQ